MFTRRKQILAKKKIDIEAPEEEVNVPEEKEKAPEQTVEEKLVAELAAQKEAYLRLAAEYDNFRKRTAKEKEESFTNAKSTVFQDFLPVLDNFDRALEADTGAVEDFKKGIEMTYTQFLSVFTKYGVETFGEAGEQFDPNIHNAVMHVDDESLDTNVVTDVFQKGYKIKEKILRPAMVKVAN
ncbi:MAG: nucleotide exchange factor GrpE [Oscillospiraceae bacterium]|nr:nucleotide exchange factor GrpE [Candidatus Limimonas coprohippi]